MWIFLFWVYLYLLISCCFVDVVPVTKDLSDDHGFPVQDNVPMMNFRCIEGNNGDVNAVAVAFFGMSRNLSLVYPSIQRHVFNVLDDAHISYDIFWYTVVSANPIAHTRRREHDARTNDVDESNFFDVAMVPVCRFAVKNQEMLRFRELQDFLLRRNTTKRNHEYDQWRDHYVSVQNLLVAYYTQEEVYDMIRAHEEVNGINYKGILAIRPDTAMMKDIDLPGKLIPHYKILSSKKLNQDRTIWLPDFQHFKGYNDRAAFGTVPAMSWYMKRGLRYRDTKYQGPGEAFLKDYAKWHHLDVRMSKMRVLRVRSNGALAPPDYDKLYMNLHEHDADFRRCVQFRYYNITC